MAPWRLGARHCSDDKSQKSEIGGRRTGKDQRLEFEKLRRLEDKRSEVGRRWKMDDGRRRTDDGGRRAGRHRSLEVEKMSLSVR